MTVMLRKGRFAARYAQSDADVTAAQRLRHRSFVINAGRTALSGGLDRDAYDRCCRHVLIEDAAGRLAACFRLLLLPDGTTIGRSYAAQYYDLTRLAAFPGPLVEIGRFCIDPDLKNPDLLRVAWGALAGFVDQHGVRLLFGCSSFAGVDPVVYAAAFERLGTDHPAPARWAPGVKAPEVVRYPVQGTDRQLALLQMPPLLRSYLGIGGWVSDHAVVDRAMNTLHVFTGVEIAAIPALRARVLRAVAV